jgi:hypothetical protein
MRKIKARKIKKKRKKKKRNDKWRQEGRRHLCFKSVAHGVASVMPERKNFTLICKTFSKTSPKL